MKKLVQSVPIEGYVFALLATALWSGNFIVARHLADVVPPVSLAFWRWSIAFLILTPFALRSFVRSWQVLKKHIPYLFFTSLFGVTIFNTLLYVAGQTTPAINLSLISITFPIFIIIISRFLYKEEFTPVKILGIIMVIFGVVVIITKGSFSNLSQMQFFKGDIWMLIAALIFAVYSVLLRQKPKELNVLSFQYATFMFGLLMLLPFFLIETSLVPAVEYNRNTIASLFYVGIGASLLAYLFWNKAILTIGPTKSGMVYYTLPLFSGLLAFLILDEPLGLFHLLSALLIISGIVLSNYTSKGKPSPES